MFPWQTLTTLPKRGHTMSYVVVLQSHPQAPGLYGGFGRICHVIAPPTYTVVVTVKVTYATT